MQQKRKNLSLWFKIQQTMAIALELGVCHLHLEFIANALGSFGLLKAAGAVTAGALETFLHGLHYLFVFVKANLTHLHSSMRLRTVALSA